MSLKKNKDILESISNEVYTRLTPEAIVSAMLKQEVAGQRVFYVYLKQRGYDIKPESMDKHLSDGIIGNAIIECKLDESEGGGPKKAYQELYDTIPNRLKGKGVRLPFYRIYVELETFLVEVYDCHCKLVETFNWHKDYAKFAKYFYDDQHTFEYDLLDESVDLVEVIQNIYKVFPIIEKIDAYSKLQEGVIGWFKPFDFAKVNVNRLILNNDRMNEKYVQKHEGAFFTPPQYVRISTQYVLNAIEQSKNEGYDDYVIVDRCAGVGNLESQFSDEIYPHLILGTINEAEALTANIRFNDKAKVIVMDALKRSGVEYYRDEIEGYKTRNNVKNLAVIFLENPPYRNASGNIHELRKIDETDRDFVWKEMTKVKNNFRNTNISSVRDMCNRFIWSAYEYYQPTHYVLYAPIGYWKSVGLIDKTFHGGYVCNRKHFNATEAAILLAHWGRENKVNSYLACNSDIGDVTLRPVYNTVSSYTQKYIKNADNVFGYIYTTQGTPDFKHGGLISSRDYKPSIRGIFSITEKDILNQCPLFSANCFEPAEYTEKELIMKSSDGGINYQKDFSFLQNCLLYTLCTNKNHCDTDSQFYVLADCNLTKSMKKTEVYKLYTELVNETGINGLYNIEKYNKAGHGKLWKQHVLFPKVAKLKSLLQTLFDDQIRPSLFKYELIK